MGWCDAYAAFLLSILKNWKNIFMNFLLKWQKVELNE